MKKLIPCLLFFIHIHFAFSQDAEWDNPQHREMGDILKYGLIASGETLFGNLSLMLINMTYGFSWSTPSAKGVKDNFTTPWQWEGMDRFVVNQLAHPYHGGLSFSTGRSNGFGFYESVFFSVLGASTWETFCESQHASLNDFITTSVTSMATGEMLYRLHLEAYAASSSLPLAFIVNPLGGFHILITNGRKTPNPGKNIYQLQARIGGGYNKTNYSLTDDQQEIFSFDGGFGSFDLKLIYGDPFEQDTFIPYRHFELSASVSTRLGSYVNSSIISDGYLFSFQPIYTDNNAMSTGLSMHFDYISMGRFDIWSSGFDIQNSSLDWTIKHQHLFSENTAMELKCHAGFTFWGVSTYYRENNPKDLLNYGYGLNSKLFFTLENKKMGKLEADMFFYTLWTYPPTSAFSDGTVYWLFTDITYSRFFSKIFSAGITGSLAREWTSFNENSSYPNTRKKNDAIKVFVAWNL